MMEKTFNTGLVVSGGQLPASNVSHADVIKAGQAAETAAAKVSHLSKLVGELSSHLKGGASQAVKYSQALVDLSKQSKFAAGYGTELVTSTSKYTKALLAAKEATRYLANGLKFLGGPYAAGIKLAFELGTAVYTLASSYESASARSKRLKDETDALIKSLNSLSITKVFEKYDQLSKQRVSLETELREKQVAKEAEKKRESRPGNKSITGIGQWNFNNQEIRVQENVDNNQLQFDSVNTELQERLNLTGKSIAAIQELDSADQALLLTWYEQQESNTLQIQQRERMLALAEKHPEMAAVIAEGIKTLSAETDNQTTAQVGLLSQLTQEYDLLQLDEKQRFIHNKLRSATTEELTKNKAQLTAVAEKLFEEQQSRTALLPRLEEELRLMGESSKVRFVENQLRSASKYELEKHGDALRIAAERLYEEQVARQSILPDIEEEIRLLGLSERARFIELRMRSATAEEIEKHGDKLRERIGYLYDEEQKLKDVAKATQEVVKAADPYQEAWAEANQHIDRSFEDLWKGNLESFKDFGEQLSKGFKSILLDLSYDVVGKPLLSSFKNMIGLSTAGNHVSSKGNARSDASGSDAFSLISNGASLLSPGMAVGITNALGLGGVSAGMGSLAADFALSSIGTSLGLSTLGGGATGAALASTYGLTTGVASGTAATATVTAAGGNLISGMAAYGPYAAAAAVVMSLLAGKKPSDKTQWAGYTGEDNYVYSGGAEGKKYSKENRDAATQVAELLSRFDQTLDTHSGKESNVSLQVTVGDRDGINIKGSTNVTTKGDLTETPNGSTDLGEADVQIYGGSDLEEAMNDAVEYMAEQAGVSLEIYKNLSNEDEMLADAYSRLEQTEDAVKKSLESLGIPFTAVGDMALTLSDTLVDAVGDLQTYATNSDNYYNYVYSQEERALKQREQYQGLLNEFNAEFDAEITDKESLRSYVEGLGDLSESNADAYASALELTYAVQGLEQSMDAAGGAAGDARRIFEAMDQDEQDYFTNWAEQINQQYQDGLAQAQKLHDQEMLNLDAQYEAGKRLVDQLEDLKLSNLSVLTPMQRQVEAASKWTDTLVRARAGDAQALAELAAAGNSYLTETRALYSSGDEYDAVWNSVTQAMEDLSGAYADEDRYETEKARLLTELNSTQDDLLTTAKSQLTEMADLYEWVNEIDLSEDINKLLTDLPSAITSGLQSVISGIQSNEANGNGSSGSTGAVSSGDSSVTSTDRFAEVTRIYTDVLGVAESDIDHEGLLYWASQLVPVAAGEHDDDYVNFSNIEQAMLNAHNSHFHGLDSVPFDGYQAELHKNEMILPAPAARFLKSAGVTVGSAGMNTEGIEKKLDNLIGQIGNLARVVGAVGGDQINAVKGTAREIARAIKVDKRTPVMV